MRIVLENNYFDFNSGHFHQIAWTDMTSSWHHLMPTHLCPNLRTIMYIHTDNNHFCRKFHWWYTFDMDILQAWFRWFYQSHEFLSSQHRMHSRNIKVKGTLLRPMICKSNHKLFLKYDSEHPKSFRLRFIRIHSESHHLITAEIEIHFNFLRRAYSSDIAVKGWQSASKNIKESLLILPHGKKLEGPLILMTSYNRGIHQWRKLSPNIGHYWTYPVPLDH